MAAGSTARKTTTRRPVRAVSDTPTDVSLNLDTYETEAPAEDFVVVVGGKRLTFTDPMEIPWQDLVELSDPEEFARLCLSEKDRDHFLNHPLSGRKMNVLMTEFRKHFGLTRTPGEAGA